MQPEFKRPQIEKPLFVFDLDSTVTRCEILPLLAREAGMEREMALRTERCMRGERPFAQDFPERVALLRQVPLCRAREIVQNVPLNPRIADFLLRHRDRALILTGNLDAWIESLLARLKMEGRCISSRARVEAGFVVGVEQIVDKGAIARALPHPFIAIGDGDNDAAMLRAADFGIAFGGVRRPSAQLAAAADAVIDDEAALCRLLESYL